MPFNKALLNKKYESKFSFCDYPRSNRYSLKINQWSLEFVPEIRGDNRGAAYLGSWFCQGEIKLFYANRPNHMKITKFPTATKSYEYGPNGPLPGPVCADIQPKQTVWPWGPTRQEFVKIFKEMFNGAVAIRDAPVSCRAGHQNNPTDKPNEVISFLYAIAYDYFIDV